MSDFANLVDGGRVLGPLLREALADEADERPILLPAIPNGVPVVIGLLESCALPVEGLPVSRDDTGVTVAPLTHLAGRTAVVIDDGIETGTVARAAASALRDSGVARLILAVPVCPSEAEADLVAHYDRVVAAVRPLEHSSLASHYADFDTIDEAEAHRLLRGLLGLRDYGH